MRPIVQISLDLTDRAEALATAALARAAGVDWLEAGTPFILAEGLHGVRALRERFPGVPIVADLKTMDGGYLEAEMMAKAGATHVVVMSRAHEETLKCVVKAGRDYGVKVMGDNLGEPDMIAGARRIEDLGCDFVIHHIGYDERRGIAAALACAFVAAVAALTAFATAAFGTVGGGGFGGGGAFVGINPSS